METAIIGTLASLELEELYVPVIEDRVSSRRDSTACLIHLGDLVKLRKS